MYSSRVEGIYQLIKLFVIWILGIMWFDIFCILYIMFYDVVWFVNI